MRSAKEREQFHQFDAAYREAWQRFSARIGFWNLLLSMMPAGGLALKTAEHEIREAELEYHTKRNLLADYMLSRSVELSNFRTRAASATPASQTLFHEHHTAG
jgi:hypothetical protein